MGTSQRVVSAARALAGETVDTVGEMSAAAAEGIVATGRAISGKRAIAPVAGIAGVALGILGVLEWPIVVAAGGASVIVGRLALRHSGDAQAELS